MTAKDASGAVAVVTDEVPLVTARVWTEWQVRRSDADAIVFSSEDRDTAEKWLRRLRNYDNSGYFLASVERRSRCESWYGEPQVVPWHSPCSWSGAVGEASEDLRCSDHAWHKRGEPVPDQFWIPAPPAAKPDSPAVSP